MRVEHLGTMTDPDGNEVEGVFLTASRAEIRAAGAFLYQEVELLPGFKPVNSAEARIAYCRWHLGEAEKAGDMALVKEVREHLAKLGVVPDQEG